jgi:hypothetical protein
MFNNIKRVLTDNKRKIYKGIRYTIQALYLFKDGQIESRPHSYTVCENGFIYNEMAPMPIEYYTVEELDSAIGKFIELESSNA